MALTFHDPSVLWPKAEEIVPQLIGDRQNAHQSNADCILLLESLTDPDPHVFIMGLNETTKDGIYDALCSELGAKGMPMGKSSFQDNGQKIWGIVIMQGNYKEDGKYLQSGSLYKKVESTIQQKKSQNSMKLQHLKHSREPKGYTVYECQVTLGA